MDGSRLRSQTVLFCPQPSRTQPVSELVSWGPYSRTKSQTLMSTHVPAQGCAWYFLKYQLVEAVPSLRFRCPFRCLLSLLRNRMVAHQNTGGGCRTAGFCFQKHNPERRMGGVQKKRANKFSARSKRLPKSREWERVLPQPKAISSRCREERCSSRRGDLPAAPRAQEGAQSDGPWGRVGAQACGQPQERNCAPDRTGRWRRANCVLKGPCR